MWVEFIAGSRFELTVLRRGFPLGTPVPPPPPHLPKKKANISKFQLDLEW